MDNGTQKGFVPAVGLGVNLISLESVNRRVQSENTSPIRALFPKAGSTEILPSIKEKVEERLSVLEQSVENAGERSAEESMLRQVLLWLNQGEVE